jgi:hypothetical protein
MIDLTGIGVADVGVSAAFLLDPDGNNIESV